MPDDLAGWWHEIQAITKPLRRDIQELGLLSGLRPGTLVGLRREWIQLDAKAISIPRMKSGRSFDLPLSDRMWGVVRRAMAVGDLHYPDAAYLTVAGGLNRPAIVGGSNS